VTGVTLLWPGAVRQPSPDEFASRLAGRTIQSIGRRAKFLLFSLYGGDTLIIHLRMTGDLRLEPASTPRPRMTRNAFSLDDGSELRFVDTRKLGVMWLVNDTSEVLADLGPEPLEPRFTVDVLSKRLARRSAPIKPLLMDQRLIAGIGNIYADEVLFQARVHPMRPAGSLSRREVTHIHRAIKRVLSEATDALASLLSTGVPPSESSEARHLLHVPRQEGASCSRCGTSIRRLVIRGRSAYFCPRCQPP
jgi:formamidopyrimidine-DNA glycosylase